MGCEVSKYSSNSNIYSDNRSVSLWKNDYATLRMEEHDVGRLFGCFSAIDSDHSGNIDIAELLVHVKLELTAFTQRVFSLFDNDGSGAIDFHELCLCLWGYCSLDESELVIFAFELYDTDGSGQMDRSEVNQLLTDVYGTTFQTNPMAKSLVNNIRTLPDQVTVPIFEVFCHEHVLLLFPAYEVQTALRNFFCGPSFWSKLQKIRKHICNRKYVPVKSFMKMYKITGDASEQQKKWQYEQDEALRKTQQKKAAAKVIPILEERSTTPPPVDRNPDLISDKRILDYHNAAKHPHPGGSPTDHAPTPHSTSTGRVSLNHGRDSKDHSHHSTNSHADEKSKSHHHHHHRDSSTQRHHEISPKHKDDNSHHFREGKVADPHPGAHGNYTLTLKDHIPSDEGVGLPPHLVTTPKIHPGGTSDDGNTETTKSKPKRRHSTAV